MRVRKAERGLDTVRAIRALVEVRRTYAHGNARVAQETAAAMRRTPATQQQLDATGVQAWHVARAVWRAKRWLPFHSTCLQTALATQRVFDQKGIDSVVRIGARHGEDGTHAWVEVGDFVLDDQRIASRFQVFQFSPESLRSER